MLVTAALAVSISGTASANRPPDAAVDLARRCELLAARGMVDVPHVTPCLPSAGPEAAPDTTAPGQGACRSGAAAAARCPRQVSRVGGFSSRVTGGVLLPDGGAVVRGVDYRSASGWQLVGVRADGGVRWTKGHRHGGLVAATELVDGGRGVIASGYTYVNNSYKFVVRRYDTRTGTVAWTARPPGGASPDTVGFRMALTRDRRTAIIAGYGHDDFSDVRPLVVAIDVATGRIKWSREISSEDSVGAAVYYVVISPDGRTAYAVGDTWINGPDVFAAALDTRTGRVRWTSRVPGPDFEGVYDAVLTADGQRLVFVGEAYLPTWNASKRLITSVDTADGEDQRRIDSPAPANSQYWWVGSAVATRSAVFAAMTSSVSVFNGVGAYAWLRAGTVAAVIAIDPAEGAVLWKAPNTPEQGGLLSDPVITASVDGARVYVAGAEADRTLYAYAPPVAGARHEASDIVVVALDAESGTSVWRSAYNASPDAPDGSAVAGITATRSGVHVFAGTTPGPRYAAPAAYRWDTQGLWLVYDL